MISLELNIYHLSFPAVEAEWAQCAKTPRDPDRRSPCPPHLLPLPSTLQAITENMRSHQNRASDELWSLKIQVWFGKSQKWHETLCDTNPCCHQRSNPALPSAPGWRCPLPHWVAWRCVYGQCCPWVHGAELAKQRRCYTWNTWNYVWILKELQLFWETHQWLVESGELHEVWCKDSFLVALDDRWLLWNQPQSVLLGTKRHAVRMLLDVANEFPGSAAYCIDDDRDLPHFSLLDHFLYEREINTIQKEHEN